MFAQKFTSSFSHASKSKLIMSALAQIRIPYVDPKEEAIAITNISRKIDMSFCDRSPVQFVLPAFPFKSKNQRTKVIGSLADKGEELALKSLYDFGVKIKDATDGDAELIVALDGFTYADIVGIDNSAVFTYMQNIINLYLNLYNRLSDRQIIKWFDNLNSLSDLEHYSIWRILDANYSQSIESIRHEIETIKEVRDGYVGLARFWAQDSDDGLTGCEELKRIGKKIAIQMMRRNRAYSDYLKAQFPNAIRLSVHRAAVINDRVPINIIQENTNYGTPWHTVAVKTKSGVWQLMKRVDAESKGCTLLYENDVPSYFMEN